MTPSKLLGLLLVIVFIVALGVLVVLDIRGVFEHHLLLPLLNTLFAGIVPIAVAYVASKAYVNHGSVTIFFMGCGMLSFGLCAILAGWLIRASDGANLNVTVYNTGAFLGAAFHAIGAILGLVGTGYSHDIRPRRLRVVLAYVGITVFVTCFSLAALRGLIPPFFIQGVGPTDLRQAILGTAVLLYFASSFFLMAYYFKWKSDFFYWYSLCLSMIAIGLFAFFVQRSVGCPIGWLGRSANYVGGIFALVAVLGAWKDARVKGVSLGTTIAEGLGGGEATYWRGFLPVLPIPIFLILSLIMASLDIRTVFEPPGLYAALNTLFLSILPLTVVYFATKGYLQRGLLTLLMLGSGTLILGLGSLSSGWVMTLEDGGPNASATIFNVTILLSAIFQMLGGLLVAIGVHLEKDTRQKNLITAFTYLGVAVLLGFLTVVTLRHLIPVFFIQGEGPTALRQAVLGTATVLFIVSGLLLVSVYLFSRAKILYWYSLALFLFATAGISFLFAKSVGSPMAWLGRSGMYLSGIYLFIAVTGAARELRVRGESLENGISSFFHHHLESLVEERTSQLNRAKEELQSAHNELERANAELEQRVLDRTAELKNANERLEEEIEERKSAENIMLARLRLAEYASSHTLDELLQATLDEAEALTGSAIGFYHFVEADQRTLCLQAWSTRTLGEMCNAEGKGLHYDLDKAGVWVDCVHEQKPVIHNDYSALPHRRGMPAGHAEVVRELVVPVFRGDRLVAILGVGNKPVDYATGDIESVSLLADLAWDISERKRAETALQAASAYNRSLIEASLDPLVTISAEGKITDVNTGTERVTGYSRNELIGRDFADYFTDPEKARAGYQQVFRDGLVKDYELEIRHKNGKLTPVIYNASIYRDDSGKVVGIFAAARDITDRKRTEEDLIRSNKDLQQFAYVASHDLQEPLRNVASCLQMLEKDYKNKLDANADQYIHYAVDSSVRMKALILDLLAYSRVATAGKPPEHVDCEQALDLTLRNLRSAIDENGATVTHDPLPTVSADESQLLQVFQNLIGNAIKFRRGDPPRIHVSAVKNGNEWIFSIKDNGVGIESQYLERIFVIFQRLHKRSEYDGTGLGLAIVKKVVERHGGRVWVESEPGIGTTFYFTLPERA